MSDLRKKNLIAGFILLSVTGLGTVGYYLIGMLAGAQPPWCLSDCFYMTVITLTTVGFGEVMDFSSIPAARLFTVLILFGGLGIAAYFVSTLTAFLVEGELTNLFWRKRMKKQLHSLSDHIIVCGIGPVGFYIIQELLRTHTPFVVIDLDENNIRLLQRKTCDFPVVIGDATHAEVPQEARVNTAKGVITTLEDDKDNLCVVVTCRQLNSQLHLISSCKSEEFSSKLSLLGAEVVIPNSIGGLRIASKMIRPRVVKYLDQMMRDKNCIVRIENIEISPQSNLIGKPLSTIDFEQFGPLLVLAVIKENTPHPLYNPRRSTILEKGDTLVVQTDIDSLDRFHKEHLN